MFQDNLLFYADTPENSRLFVQTPPDWVPYDILDIITEDIVKLQAFLLKAQDFKSAPTVGKPPPCRVLGGEATSDPSLWPLK